MSPPRRRRRPRPRRTGRSSYVPYTVAGPPGTPGLPVDPPDRRRTPRPTLGGTPPRGAGHAPGGPPAAGRRRWDDGTPATLCIRWSRAADELGGGPAASLRGV